MKESYRYSYDALPVYFILYIAIAIPAIAFYYLYDTLAQLNWNMLLLQWTGIVLYVPIVIYLTYQIILRVRYFVQIDDQGILIHRPLKNTRWNWAELSGFRIEKSNEGDYRRMFFYSKNKNKALFSIRVGLLEDKNMFTEVMSSKLSNLSFQEGQGGLSIKEIEELEAFSVNEKEQTKKEVEDEFQSIKKILRYFLITAILSLVLPVLQIFPLFSVVFIIGLLSYVWLNKGKIRIFRSSGGVYPGIALTLLFSSIAILLFAITHYELFYSPGFWLCLGISGSVIFVIVLTVTTDLRRKELSLIGATFVAILCFMYAYGMTTIINCEFDFQTPKKLHVLIYDANWDEENGGEPELTVEPFGPYQKEQTIEVHKNLYRTVKKGEKIWIHLHNGLLNSTWYHKKEMLK